MLLQLFGVFARIGAVTFGGGYAMVSLIERELADRGWLSVNEFADIVAVSQMTPGPLALNVATFVGRQLAGVPGAVSASLGLASPAIIITAIAVYLVGKGRHFNWARAAVRGIRAAVLGLIATSVLFFFDASVLPGLPDGPLWRKWTGNPIRFDQVAFGVFLLALLASGRWKQGPILVIAGAAAIGAAAGAAGLL